MIYTTLILCANTTFFCPMQSIGLCINHLKRTKAINDCAKLETECMHGKIQ